MAWGKRNSSEMIGDEGNYPPAGEIGETDVTINMPTAEDPKTGYREGLGKGRTAIIGRKGVERVVTFPAGEDIIDLLTANGELTHGD